MPLLFLGDIMCGVGVAAALAVPSAHSETDVPSRLRSLGREEAEQLAVAALFFAAG